jgi:hypothetical protein
MRTVEMSEPTLVPGVSGKRTAKNPAAAKIRPRMMR